VGPRAGVVRQRLEHGPHGDPGEDGVVHDGQRGGTGEVAQIGGERARAPVHDLVAAAAVLLAGEVDGANRREPARARVEARGHPRARAAHRHRLRVRRGRRRGEHGRVLRLQGEHRDAPGLAAQQREEALEMARGRRARPVARGHQVGEVVVDVEGARPRLGRLEVGLAHRAADHTGAASARAKRPS
jgi:hypothetical protein